MTEISKKIDWKKIRGTNDVSSSLYFSRPGETQHDETIRILREYSVNENINDRWNALGPWRYFNRLTQEAVPRVTSLKDMNSCCQNYYSRPSNCHPRQLFYCRLFGDITDYTMSVQQVPGFYFKKLRNIDNY